MPREDPGLAKRLIYALAGLVAGWVALMFTLRIIPLINSDADLIYDFFFCAGSLIGALIVVSVPPRLISQRTWLQSAALGAASGPAALILVIFIITAMQGQLRTFSLDHLDLGWPLSALVSTVAFLVYTALLKRNSTGAAAV